MSNLDERLAKFESASTALIRTHRFNELHDIIGESQLLTKMGAEPHCIALEGETGVGKSTLVKSYADSIPTRQTSWGMVKPIFYMHTPSPATVNSLAYTMLQQLGEPGISHRDTQPLRTTRLVHYLKHCKVELVILDDIQHVIDPDRDKVVHSVSEWLKFLIKETGIPFLIVSIPGYVSRILASNAQLSRLFAFREQLKPFRWAPFDGNNDETKDYVDFVARALHMYGTPLSGELQPGEYFKRLHYATDGVTANLMNLLRYATYVAIQEESEQLTLPVLEYAYDVRLSAHMEDRINPFSAAIGPNFVTQNYEKSGSSRRKKRRSRSG